MTEYSGLIFLAKHISVNSPTVSASAVVSSMLNSIIHITAITAKRCFFIGEQISMN